MFLLCFYPDFIVKNSNNNPHATDKRSTTPIYQLVCNWKGKERASM